MVHQYTLNNYNIVIDTYSGSVHVVNPVAFDMIKSYETTEKSTLLKNLQANHKDVLAEDLENCYDAIASLKEAGQLFSEDTYANLGNTKRVATAPIKALCLHVAHTCNLNCSYCFARQGNYDETANIMSYEVGKKAFDFLIAHSGSRTNLEVDFFGGEPLMDWAVIKELVAYARSVEKKHNKLFRFTLTTNGILLDDDIMEFANKEMYNVVLSLDGRKEIHDHLRQDIGGNGSYDRIVPKFQEFVKKRDGKGYYIRGTFTHNNVDFTKDIFHMSDLGFSELSMEPVVCDDSDPYALTEADLPILFQEYETLAIEMVRRKKENDNPFTFYHYTLDLGHGPCVHKRISGCGSGTEYMAVTPQGDLYPCHQFVGDAEYKLGTIFEGVTAKELVDEFANCNVYTKPDCEDCWAKLYCSGGCAANAYHATNDINGVHAYSCEVFKKRMECAIMMQVAEME
ncbi:MAG: thioether cross-link-forming SCIFF peptide maturase [Bacillota bacterium]